MNLVFLKYFITAVDMGNISQAANHLYLSRQALSKAIHHAEKELDTKLIISQGQKFTVTEEGKIFYQNAKAILKLWDSTISELDRRRTIKHTLQIGFGRMSYFAWAQDHGNDFNRQNPSIQIVVQSLVIDELIAMLRQKELDAVVSNAYIADPHYKTETLLQRPIYAIVHHSDPLCRKSILSPKDIAHKPNVFISEDKLGAEYFQTMMARLNLPARILFCTDSALTTVFNTVTAYGGVFLTSAIFNSIISPVECVCIPLETGLPKEDYNMDIRLIYRRDNPQAAAIQSYKKYLLSHVKDNFNQADHMGNPA